MPEAPAVVARGLTVRYGPHAALDGLDLEIPATGTFGLLGRNGAGKTTTIRAIAGLVRPSEGSISVLGRNPSCTPSLRRELSFLFAEDGLLPLLSPRRNLEIWGRIGGLGRQEARRRADEALDRVGLDPPGDEPVKYLSSGDRRVTALARAFLLPTKAVVLDEPTASLDPVRAAFVRRLLRELARDRMIVLSTHDLAEAEDLCSKVAIIHHGRVAASGSPRDLGSPRSTKFRVRTETGNGVTMDGRRFEPGEDGFVELDSDVPAADLLSGLIASGNRIVEFGPACRSLDRVFLDLAGD
ncbi:ABC transporter ATP-binding protein [Candidatus Fermentibacteria bacterium]|nr:ABC transporter ATP-binding protein [Candidatus Fermentibacteria bacterium]